MSTTLEKVCGYENFATFSVIVTIDNDRVQQSAFRMQAQSWAADAPGNEFADDRKQEQRIHVADKLRALFEKKTERAKEQMPSGYTSDIMRAFLQTAFDQVNWFEVANDLLED